MNDVNCLDLDLGDAAMLDRVLMLARRHTPPLPLRITEEQRKSVAADEVEGIAYVGTVPLWVEGEERPPPRPVPVVVVEPVVDLAEVRARRKQIISDELWGHVDDKIGDRERQSLLAIGLELIRLGDKANPDAVALFNGMDLWVKSAMMYAAMLRAQVDNATDVKEVDAAVVDLDLVPAPTVVDAGTLTFMFATYGGNK